MGYPAEVWRRAEEEKKRLAMRSAQREVEAAVTGLKEICEIVGHALDQASVLLKRLKDSQ